MDNLVFSFGQLDETAAARTVERRALPRRLCDRHDWRSPSIPCPDRQQLVEIVVIVAVGRVLVYGRIGNDCVPGSISVARDYHRAGADAVVAVLPCYYQLNEAEMESGLAFLAPGTLGHLLIYNIPDRTGMSIPLDVIDRLSALPDVV